MFVYSLTPVKCRAKIKNSKPPSCDSTSISSKERGNKNLIKPPLERINFGQETKTYFKNSLTNKVLKAMFVLLMIIR
jgi:hypothetical protein